MSKLHREASNAWEIVSRAASAAVAKRVSCRAALLVGLLALLQSCPGFSPLAARRARADEPAPVAKNEAAPAKGAERQPGALDLDDPVEPLTPLKPRTGLEADRVEAEALFTAARVAEQKQDFASALRYYQRAYRRDPGSSAALREIPSLAFSLDQPAVAVRDAVLEGDTETMEPVALRRLATALVENGAHEAALRLFRRLAKLEAHDKPSSGQAALWMHLGRLEFNAKQYSAAAENFARVVKALDHADEYGLDDSHRRRLLGKSDLAYLLFGEAFLEAGRLDEASAAFAKANSLVPNEGVFAYNQARVLEKEHKPAEALERLSVFLEKHPGGQGLRPYELLARLLKETGAEGQLDPRLDQLLAIDPNTPLTFFAAKHFEDTEQWDKSEQLYLRLLDGKPEKTPAEVLAGLADIYWRKHDIPRLLDTLGDAAARDESLAPVSEVAKKLAAEPDTVRQLADLARKDAADPNGDPSPSRPLAVAMLAIEAKDYALAGEFFDKAIAAAPNKKAEFLLLWGSGLLIAERTDDAIRVFRRGISEQALPDNAAFDFYLSGALEIAGHTDEALAAADRAAQARKDNPRFHARRAWILYHAKRYDAAREAYQALLKKFDANHDSEDAREALRDARSALSNIEVAEHHMDAAEEWLEQVLDEFPENIGALNDLGYLWADENKHLDRALRMIEVAVKAEPKNMAYLDSLGWALFRLGRYREAIPPLTAATADPKADTTVFEHLGDAEDKAGHAAAADAAWQSAVKRMEDEKEPDQQKIAAIKAKLARGKNP